MKNETTTAASAVGPQPRCASLFGQILNLLDRRQFDTAVARTGTEQRSKGFSRWDQFVAMCFCHPLDTPPQLPPDPQLSFDLDSISASG